MAAYKVYISSTFRDLKTYRETVRESLHKVSNFTVVGMEDYVAEDLQPLDRCLLDVEACDIYLLVLANRYGYVIDGQELSITHQEYTKAKELKKVILVFKADNFDGRFLPDADEAGQPSSAEKQKKLKALKDEVGSKFLSHPEGFTSEHHLALQIMESLVRSPRVDFELHEEVSEDRKLFCNRATQVSDFYDLIRRKKSFNVFLIQGQRPDLGRSLVDRLSRFHLGIQQLTMVSFHEFIADPSYPNVRRRLVNELCNQLLPNDPDPPVDPVGLLKALYQNELRAISLLSLINDTIQWQEGYPFLTSIFEEFEQASQQVPGVRLFWFILIDTPGMLPQQIQSQQVTATPPLKMVPAQTFRPG